MLQVAVNIKAEITILAAMCTYIQRLIHMAGAPIKATTVHRRFVTPALMPQGVPLMAKTETELVLLYISC